MLTDKWQKRKQNYAERKKNMPKYVVLYYHQWLCELSLELK